MQTIHLHREDLVELLRLIDEINPEDSGKLGSGMVTVNCDSSSGIGSIITAELPVLLGDTRGTFVAVISDESNW